VIRSFVFTTQGRLQSRTIEPPLASGLLRDPNVFLWIDLEKPPAQEARLWLEEIFNFHPLSIEDCIAPTPSPKVEEYVPREDDRFSPYLFIVMHAVDYTPTEDCFAKSELNLFLGANFLVSYHDDPLRSVTQVEDSVLKGTLHPPRAPDRLAHSLLDALVENYKPALEAFSLRIAEMEQMALEGPDKGTLGKILQLKKMVVQLRRTISPEQEVLARFAHGEFKLIRPRLVPYFRDTHDALSHLSDLAQSYADSLTGTLQVYLNVSSNQTGEVVKVLTLITVITTPLMMIGTWYGMNFQHMPELAAEHGYLVACGAMLISTGVTIWYFKKKKWF